MREQCNCPGRESNFAHRPGCLVAAPEASRAETREARADNARLSDENHERRKDIIRVGSERDAANAAAKTRAFPAATPTEKGRAR